MVTIYTITYNEEMLIEFFIKHYKKLFPNCHIVVYDNESTDNTANIATNLGCEVRLYSTNNTLSDGKYLEIKNNCWKNSKTNWNLICDCDELVLINDIDLKQEESLGNNIILFEGYTMINNTNIINIESMKRGYRDRGYDKMYLFNKKQIEEINYAPGCHSCNPIAKNGYIIKYSNNIYRALHYKCLSPQYTIERNKLFSQRMSKENEEKGWGFHYRFSEKSIIDHYNNKDKVAIKLI